MLSCIKILESGELNDLQNLIKTSNLVRIRDADYNTLLHHACLMGNFEAVQMLMNSGLHADVPNVDGQTPICDAAMNGSTEIISYLIKFGVDVDPPSYWGSPLIYATQKEHIGAMKLLIEAGARLNSPDRVGYCPLHMAVRQQFRAGVELLLMEGADPNYPVRLTTPLHMAVKLNDFDIVELLLAHGAYPKPMDMDRRTPMDYTTDGSPICDLLKSYENRVPTLQFLARLAARPVIRNCSSTGLDQLRLPKYLRDYVLFRFL